MGLPLLGSDGTSRVLSDIVFSSVGFFAVIVNTVTAIGVTNGQFLVECSGHQLGSIGVRSFNGEYYIFGFGFHTILVNGKSSYVLNWMDDCWQIHADICQLGYFHDGKSSIVEMVVYVSLAEEVNILSR